MPRSILIARVRVCPFTCKARDLEGTDASTRQLQPSLPPTVLLLHLPVPLSKRRTATVMWNGNPHYLLPYTAARPEQDRFRKAGFAWRYITLIDPNRRPYSPKNVAV